MPNPSSQRILLIRPSALGDVCRTVPVLVSLKRAYPDAAVDWLVQDTFVEAVEHHPDLTDAILFPRKAMARWTRPAAWGRIRAFLGMLRDRHYDVVLDCQGLARSGLFAATTCAPRRVGLANAAELGWLGLTDGVSAPRCLHAVDRMMLVAQAAGAAPVYDMRLYTTAADREHVRMRFGLEPGRFVLLAPTTRWPAKLWPGDRFAELARRLLADRLTERVVFVGAEAEGSQCNEMRALAATDSRVVDLVGRTSVGQLLAVVEAAGLVVASDSAALHMAVGFHRPLIGLFGPTRIELVGPYQREADVIQHITPGDRLDHKEAAAGRQLMARITIEEVLSAARTRLATAAPVQQPPPRSHATVITAPSSRASPSPG